MPRKMQNLRLKQAIETQAGSKAKGDSVRDIEGRELDPLRVTVRKPAVLD